MERKRNKSQLDTALPPALHPSHPSVSFSPGETHDELKLHYLAA